MVQTVRRTSVFVVAVEVGFPLSMLAWRFSLQHASPAFASYLQPVEHVLPWLVAPLAILIWVTLRRLRDGRPSWRWTLPVVLAQFAVTLCGQWWEPTVIVPLIFGCTVLITLPDPWALPAFGVIIAVGVGTAWTAPWLAILGLLLHNLLVGLAISAVVRMGELAIALRRAQDLLAGFAVVQERARVAQDLHDTLGQDLAAVGLRAELAARLLSSEPGRAAAEIRAVQQMTEQTLDDIRHVARGTWQPVFEDELTTGTALLESAGVRCRVRAAGQPNERTGLVAGWALREGITNILKHSDARECVLTSEIREGVFRLTIENDGVRDSSGQPGCGLTGVDERAAKLGGNLRFGTTGKRFRLVLEVPIGEKA